MYAFPFGNLAPCMMYYIKKEVLLHVEVEKEDFKKTSLPLFFCLPVINNLFFRRQEQL